MLNVSFNWAQIIFLINILKARKEMGLDDTDDSLKSLIMARQQSRGQQVE